jgi:hypothetical protein
VPSQQLQDQLQTQHSVDTGNYITDKQNIKPKINYRQVLEEKHINGESKQRTSKQTKMRGNNNYITQKTSGM